jgi:glyceraldehyde-3-phosphate dehydrogenase (NADP+)
LKRTSGHILVLDPDDGSRVGEVPLAGETEIERALALGEAACARTLPSWRRAEILEAAANAVAADAEAFATTIAREGIKTILEARREVARAVLTLKLSADEAKRTGTKPLAMDQVRGGDGLLGLLSRQPVGLAIAMTPYNDPLNLIAHKLGPAIAADAPIILKPHPATPLSAERLLNVLRAAGLPEDRAQLLHGGPAIALALTRDARPRLLSFTGGRAGGEALATVAGRKRLLMELGGVGLVVVCEGADLVRAADSIHEGAFWAAGQNCVHAQRILVADRVADDLTAMLLERCRAMTLGPKLDERTHMGPMIDLGACERVASHVAQGLAAGGRLIAGGERHGNRHQPTWITFASGAHPLAKTEIFGPVSTLEPFASFPEALGRVAEADDAINAAIFTPRLDEALDFHAAARAGAIIVNGSTDFRIDAMPFGGPGCAGIGREGVGWAVEALTEPRLLVLGLSRR